MRSAAAITGGDSCLLAKTCAPGRAVRSDDGADSAGGCNALASRLPLQGPRVDPNLLLVARDSPLRTATTAPDSPARDDDTPLLPLRYAIRLDGGEHSSGRDRPRHGDRVDHDDNNDMDEPPITAASTGKPPIRLACLAGARPGRVRRGSSDLDLLTRVSISEDIDPNLHTPTKDTVIPFADPNPMTPPSPPAMHLPPQESPTPELKQPPLPMTPGDDERSTARLQAIPPDTIPPDLSTTSSTSTPLLCAVCCVLSAGCDLPYAATPPTHTPPPLVLFSNIPGERVVKRVRPPTWLTLSRPPRLACAG